MRNFSARENARGGRGNDRHGGKGGDVMTVYRFQEVTRKRKVRVVCVGCMKPLIRTLSVTHTVNPFNRNADGIAKTYAEVSADVTAALALLEAEIKRDGVTCRKCS